MDHLARLPGLNTKTVYSRNGHPSQNSSRATLLVCTTPLNSKANCQSVNVTVLAVKLNYPCNSQNAGHVYVL